MRITVKRREFKASRDLVIIFSTLGLIFWFSNLSSGVIRTPASSKLSLNCFNALKSLIFKNEIKIGGQVSLITNSGKSLEGKITIFSRGGFQISDSKGSYLISFSDVESINGEALSEIEIYRALITDQIKKIADTDDVNIHFHNGYDFSNIKGRKLKATDETLNFINAEDGREMTFAYEKVYGIDVIDPLKKIKEIQRDIKLLNGEFVTVEMKDGTNLDGIVSLSTDAKSVEIVNIEDSKDIVTVPISDVESVYQ